MSYPPAKPVPQLRSGYPTARVDCGVCSCLVALDHASGGLVSSTIPEMRQRGNMGNGPTGSPGWKRGIESYGLAFAAAGLMPPVFYRMGFVDAAAIKEQLAIKRALLVVGIRYAVLQDDVAWHPYRGGTKYRGLHAIAARGLFRQWGTGWRRIRRKNLATLKPDVQLWTEILDPLADGRRPAVPQAPQRWPLALFLAAGDACRNPGDGLMSVGVIYRSAKLEETQP